MASATAAALAATNLLLLLLPPLSGAVGLLFVQPPRTSLLSPALLQQSRHSSRARLLFWEETGEKRCLSRPSWCSSSGGTSSAFRRTCCTLATARSRSNGHGEVPAAVGGVSTRASLLGRSSSRARELVVSKMASAVSPAIHEGLGEGGELPSEDRPAAHSSIERSDDCSETEADTTGGALVPGADPSEGVAGSGFEGDRGGGRDAGLGRRWRRNKLNEGAEKEDGVEPRKGIFTYDWERGKRVKWVASKNSRAVVVRQM